MSELSEQELQLEITRLRKAQVAAKQRRESEEKAQAIRDRASKKLASDPKYAGLLEKFHALAQDVKAVLDVASSAGADTLKQANDHLARAAGQIASGKHTLQLTDEERALFPAPKPVAKKAAKRGLK